MVEPWCRFDLQHLRGRQDTGDLITSYKNDPFHFLFFVRPTLDVHWISSNVPSTALLTAFSLKSVDWLQRKLLVNYA